MASRRSGLRRGLDDIPADREGASGVLAQMASETPPASPSAPVRLRVVGESDEPAQKARRTERRGKPRVTPRTRTAKARVAAPPPSPEPVAAESRARDGAPAIAKGSVETIRVFYERLGREVSRVFTETMRQVLDSGAGLENVIPQVWGRLFRAYGGLPGRVQDQLAGLFKSTGANELLDPGTWQGLYYLVESSLSHKLEVKKRRRAGEYEIDEFGLDEEFLFSVQPIFRFLYQKWFRVTATGLANVPSSGRALFVANHSGVLPYDGGMVAMAIWDEHPSPRLARALYLEWFVSVPFVQPFLQRTGQVMANPENGERLLKRDHLVTVFPEGLKGVGKLFKDRYQLARFGRGGFIKMAMRARAPIIPVSVVGAEEIHPVLMQLDFLAKPLGLPFAPLTPTFPLLGPLGLIPLPSKWSIHFGEPIDMSDYDPADAADFHLVSQLSDHVRTEIQHRIHTLLLERKSVFGG